MSDNELPEIPVYWGAQPYPADYWGAAPIRGRAVRIAHEILEDNRNDPSPGNLASLVIDAMIRDGILPDELADHQHYQ